MVEVNFVLSGTFLVVACFWLNAHLFKCKAYFAADVFPFVFWGNVHVACPVKRNFCWLSFFVQFKKVEFYFCSKAEFHSEFFAGFFYCVAKNLSAVLFVGASVRVGDCAEHPYNFSGVWPPGKDSNCCWVRVQEKV